MLISTLGVALVVLVLDENVPDRQRDLLSRRMSVRQVGVDLGWKGMKDADVITLLHDLARPTFLTLDLDYYRRRWCHERYCLIFMDVHRNDVAVFARRILKHRDLKTWAKRSGAVIRVMPSGLAVWRWHERSQQRLAW